MINTQEDFIVGMRKLAKAVGSTLGPDGHLVAYQHTDGTRLTKDGVTVASFVELEKEVEQMGADFLRSVAKQLVNQAGDGTTTVTVLTMELIEQALAILKAQPENANEKITAKTLENYFQVYKDELMGYLQELVQELKPSKLKNIARVSANDVALADLIVDAVNVVGQEGVVEVLDGDRDYYEHIPGVSWKQGYLTPHFVTSEDQTAFYRDAKILIYDGTLSTQEQVIPFLEYSMSRGVPLIFIANDFTGPAAETLILNRIRKAAQIVPVKGPFVGQRRSDFYADLAILTGAEVFKEKVHSLSKWNQPNLLGSCDKVLVTRDGTSIVDPRGNPEAIERRIANLKGYLELEKEPYNREKYMERLGMISNKMVMLYISGSTEIEIKEKRDRVDDALKAIRASLQSGYLPGGGSSLLICGKSLKPVDSSGVAKQARDAIVAMCNAPIRKIAENAGYSPEVIVDKAYSKNGMKNRYVWNAVEDSFEHIDDTNIIDPASVTMLALKTAIDTACIAIRTSVVLHPNESYQSQFSSMAL